ncbi:RecQ family ATP-dependent DNA helicase [Mucilaginibacter celer]|uniref:DNA 3'-5' helicase n=1 Tax=Mucilaginibacter celer TaxID=2305508 RepID=A0A494VNC3_9SPHI|nr:RecQ family ATP-dependent DNA helicase [Mucilaginibacter celer]AYL96174.1 RecQ family ATP-dependent DNA helicase [Mucilaginibacter celer]
MNSIAFVDTEINPKNDRIMDIGAIKDNESAFHNPSEIEFGRFISGVQFICGHNILNHDIKYIGRIIADVGINGLNIIDTLFLSPLLFPANPYHALLKDDKLQSDDLNNPLNDSKKAKELFFDEVTAFKQTDGTLKQIYYLLLNQTREFGAFFRFIGYLCPDTGVRDLIRQKFKDQICSEAGLMKAISNHPIELAYSLALINANHRYSITPPWVLMNYPKVEWIIYSLRNNPCITGCPYCLQAMDAHRGLKRFFGFDEFRKYGDEPLQEKAVKAAINNKSLLAVFPTGGGKSITFQVPALMAGENSKSLTVVISPLQSLMKDQVDNLEKIGITDAVTINGLLDPIEKAKSFERVENGSAALLYISPESLRSKTIERLLLGRKIARFVIDEAHCFSSWGQDFRVDYLYIGDFIKALQHKKSLDYTIPVSCFTATAKQKVIEDIREYFRNKLSLELDLFTSKASRTNLQYQVFSKEGNDEKYQTVRDLIEQKNCPTIVYVSRTRNAENIADKLATDGFNARAFHGKMDAKLKTANQNAFIAGEVQIMVATSAFGMGVDKKDVGLVIHYELSDSLENYVQEAGRAGRDENIEADCYALFNEEDLSKHFIMHNQTKLSIKEIQQVWKAVKDITKFRSTVSNSALEIARKAGWDDNVAEIETRVKTAISALEDAGYLKRGQNMPRVFANSILAKTAQEAIDKINLSTRFDDKQKQKAVRIIKKLFSSKSKKQGNEETAESRVDYIGDHLGLMNGDVIAIINLLREEKILADTKDLTAFIKRTENKNRSLAIVETFARIEKFLLPYFEQEEKTIQVKELNEAAANAGFDDVNPNKIKTIINFWSIKKWIKRQSSDFSKSHFVVMANYPEAELQDKMNKRHELARFIVAFLYQRNISDPEKGKENSEETLIEFSVHELKTAYENSQTLFKVDVTIDDIEDTLFYLSRIEAIKIEGGFMVVYNRLTIERLEQDNKIRYKVEDYQKLEQFYANKVQQIHIVGEYAKKMIADYKEALQFVEDYFQLNYSSFLNKYFKGNRRDEINLTITATKFQQLFGELSHTQLAIIKDKDAKHVAVAAGPGSGKTRVLVHKLASLFFMEDVKHEQLLMLTFSREAATEFKKRLIKLIGNAALRIEIKTFHSYCFDLLGKIGSLEKSDQILKQAIKKIRNSEVEVNRITKTVLVIDEAQDMDSDEFDLVRALMEQNDEMRVIAVGDDDQNIYEFRGASSKYLEEFITVNRAARHELIENYRSKSNLVSFSNQFVQTLRHRLKQTPIAAKQTDDGKIKLVQYQHKNLIVPLVEDIVNTGLTGTTCVLVTTNDEALKITGLLIKKGFKAKLIQSNDGFNLYDLLEVRYFISRLYLTDDVYTIDDEIWKNAKTDLVKNFQRSARLELCNKMLRDFEVINPKLKYKSDLVSFIRESKLEDFFDQNGETIFVSTIHKAKGKEFDNVFMMLEDFNVSTDEKKRQLYVGMTRAKKNLTIHVNSNLFDGFSATNLERAENNDVHPEPNQLTILLTHRDIWLDYFDSRQSFISQLLSGDKLIVSGDECLTTARQSVLKFSNGFLKQIEELKNKGYTLKSAKVNFIVYWQSERIAQEIKIILPALYFEKV